tara:strand:- start:1820 stop:3217 length:1398 start_codon:yes stop_codon:yes gene_type:complete
MPHSLFHFDSSPSFSLPAGMDMNQAAIMNPMMQPVPILGQQSFSAFEPDTSINDSISRQTRQTRRLNQRFDDGPVLEEEESSFGDSLLAGLAFLGNLTGGATKAAGNLSFPRARERAQERPAFTNAGTLTELAEMSALADRGRDPIRATYQLGPDYNYETVMERESGEVFVPSVSQLDAFMDGMEAGSQPTATGLGLGGSEGVVFGGGQPPMTQAETRAMLQERFGAPTISAILDLPSGQGLGMMTDAQGRMISPGDDRTAFDQASLDRLARLEQRDLRPGETLQERDTRIADSRLEGADTGTDTDRDMTFEEARKFVPRGQREKVKAYNERVRAFQAQQNSTLNKLKEEYEQLRVSGQNINNARLTALAAQYQQTEPQKYRETVQIAQEMLRDGILQDEIQAAMYVVQTMGGKVSDIFDPDRPGGTVIPPTTQLDKQTARDILDEAGGDVEEARRIAKERGFVL